MSSACLQDLEAHKIWEWIIKFTLFYFIIVILPLSNIVTLQMLSLSIAIKHYMMESSYLSIVHPVNVAVMSHHTQDSDAILIWLPLSLPCSHSAD